MVNLREVTDSVNKVLFEYDVRITNKISEMKVVNDSPTPSIDPGRKSNLKNGVKKN